MCGMEFPERGVKRDGAAPRCRLTHDVGLKLAELQLDPRLGTALLAAAKLGCSEELCTIAAIMSVRSIWAASKSKAFHAARLKFAVAEGVSGPPPPLPHLPPLASSAGVSTDSQRLLVLQCTCTCDGEECLRVRRADGGSIMCTWGLQGT